MSGAVLIMPRGIDAWPTAEALWITAAGWARAAEERFGDAWVTTPDGAWRPEDLPRGGGLPSTTTATDPAAHRRRLPVPLPAAARTLLKDLRLWRHQSRFQADPGGPWRNTPLRLVWEHHDLFNRAGRRLADAAGAPLVRYVHAPQVWEAAKWGVRRPLWGRLLTSGEARAAAGADLVACVSAAVERELAAMGVPAERLLVVPMAVDTGRFSATGEGRRGDLGIPQDAVVVGWCGSFRPFHGLGTLIDAFADAAGAARSRGPGRSDLHLLLVGDGATRPELEARASAAGVGHRVTFAGRVPHASMPAHLRAMDLAVVASDGGGGFHYSPLKLREYAACGLPVVAPAEGELAGLEEHGFLRLHRPGSREGLASAIVELAADRRRRRDMGRRARAHAEAHWTWDAQLARVMSRLDELGPRGDGG